MKDGINDAGEIFIWDLGFTAGLRKNGMSVFAAFKSWSVFIHGGRAVVRKTFDMQVTEFTGRLR